MALLLYSVIVATMGIGLLEGSEIAMMMVAAASKHKWNTAWRVAFAALATLIPLIAALYFFFTLIPPRVAGLAAGIIIFALGAHFFYEGFAGRKGHKQTEKEDEKIAKAGLLGIYAAMLLEEAEAGSITMSIGVAAGGAYASAILGMLLCLLIPLIALKMLEPMIEKIPEWIVQLAILSVMIVAALLIIIYRV